MVFQNAQRLIYSPLAARRKTSRTNSTFGFLPTHKPTLKKPKELFFSQRLTHN